MVLEVAFPSGQACFQLEAFSQAWGRTGLDGRHYKKFPALSEDKAGRIEKELSEWEITGLAFFGGDNPQIGFGGYQIHQSVNHAESRQGNDGGE